MIFNYPLWLLVLGVVNFCNVELLAMLYPAPRGWDFASAVTGAALQSLFVVALANLALSWLTRKGTQSRRQSALYMFILFSTGLYLVDFVIFRVIGIHLGTALSMLLTGHWQDFLVTLRATEMKEQDYYKLIMALILSTGLSIFFIRVSLRISRRFPLCFSFEKVCTVVAALCLTLFTTEQALSLKLKNQTIFAQEQERTLGYLTIVPARPDFLRYKVEMRPYQRPDVATRPFSTDPGPVPSDALVFYFITETLRGDFVNPEIMPELHRFKEAHTHFLYEKSNGNATHMSWHAMYLGDHPIHWRNYRNEKSWKGSLPVQYFRQAGFKVRLYNKPIDNEFFDSKRMFFGSDFSLVDSNFEVDPESPVEQDLQDLQALVHDLKSKPQNGRQLYIVNFDVAHHNYNWPESFGTPFKPVIDSFKYTQWDYSPNDVQKIRNRYKNTLSYLDSLFASFFASLKELGLYERATIAIVGDHGEEFMEHGHLIHGSSAVNEQSTIGLYMKSPRLPPGRRDLVMSQIHVWPTLMDLVGIDPEPMYDLLPGRSILNPQLAHRYAITTVANGSNAPFAFAMATANAKLFFELEKDRPLISKFLKVISVTDVNDRALFAENVPLTEIKAFVDREFLPYLRDSGMFLSVD